MALTILDKVELALNKHNDHEYAQQLLNEWTSESKQFFLSKLDWIEKAIDSGNHEANYIAILQLKEAFTNQVQVLDKLHDILLFSESNES